MEAGTPARDELVPHGAAVNVKTLKMRRKSFTVKKAASGRATF
jgi:hypothetical protein